MTSKELEQSCARVYNEISEHRERMERAGRTYLIDDRYAARIEMERRCGSMVVEMKLLEKVPADEDGPEGYERAFFEDDVPASVFVRFAEVKSVVEAWRSGRLVELPPGIGPLPMRVDPSRPRHLRRRREE